MPLPHRRAGCRTRAVLFDRVAFGPRQPGPIVKYRIGEDQPGGSGMILQSVAVGESGLCPLWVTLADIGAALSNVRFTPESGHHRKPSPCLLSANNGHCRIATSFDHLVGAGEQWCRKSQPKFLGGLNVKHEFNLDCLPNRQVRRRRASKYT